MVDVSQKKITRRIARASAKILLNKAAYKVLIGRITEKGDILESAKISGIMAAKNIAGIIPYCHQLNLSRVSMDFTLDSKKRVLKIISEVVCDGKTGVEMEALASVSVAALTVYDMLKKIDREIVISDTKLLYKSGGKTGIYERRK